MKEQDFAKAKKIYEKIQAFEAAKKVIEAGSWTICTVPMQDGEQSVLASHALGSTEDWTQRLAKSILLGDLDSAIADARSEWEATGVVLEEAQALPREMEPLAA